MNCGICGREGGKPYELQGGRIIGTTCGNDVCGSLLWESVVAPAESESERTWLAWRIKKRQAEAAGETFADRLPADLELEQARLEFLVKFGSEEEAA